MELVMELLGERDTRVLKTVVAQYIVTGEPVGSRLVAKISGLNLSSASIRNLMMEPSGTPRNDRNATSLRLPGERCKGFVVASEAKQSRSRE